MENLISEKIINRNDKIKGILIDSTEEDNEEKNGNITFKEETEENNFSTNFAEQTELTEEERNLRQNYLKKVTQKEAIIRSIFLDKKAIFSKILIFIIGIIYDLISFKEIKYKSDAVNAITTKDYDKFIISLKYHIISIALSWTLKQIESIIIKYFNLDNDFNNVILENFLLKKDMEFFDLYKTGELINKVTLNRNYPIFNIIESCTKIGEYIFKIIYYGYRLYKDFFGISIIYFLIMFIQTIITEKFMFQDDSTIDLLEKSELRDNYINDIISNIRLVKSFATEKKELKRISNIMEKIKKKSLLLSIIEEFHCQLSLISELFIFYMSGKNTILGKMDYGELLLFERYSMEFQSSFASLKGLLRSIKDGIDSWVKFLEIYDIEQKILSRKNIIPKNDMNADNNKEIKGLSIDFKNVSFSYPTKKNTCIINDLNLNVEPGKTIAIVGSSGSGKTTLTNLLLRFYDVDKGQILINGIDIKDIDLSWLRNSIGIVSQEPILTSGTIRENILYGVDNYTEKKFIEVSKLSNVYSFATNKKLFPKEFETIVGERGIKVSGGQKQRIAIARALMKNSKILIFDEATSALDSENEAIVQEAINNVINKKKITTIIIAHRLSTVKNANIIYVMKYGKIVEFGTHSELISKNGEYKKLIQRQLSN